MDQEQAAHTALVVVGTILLRSIWVSFRQWLKKRANAYRESVGEPPRD